MGTVLNHSFQIENHEAENAALTIHETIENEFKPEYGEGSIGIRTRFTFERLGRQTEPCRIENNNVNNGVDLVIWLGHETFRTPKGKIPNSFDDGVVMSTFSLGAAAAIATANGIEFRNSGGNFKAEPFGNEIMPQLGIFVNSGENRKHAIATDRLRELSKSLQKEIGIIKALKPSDGWEREALTDNKSKRTKVICSDGCMLGEVITVSAMIASIKLVESYTCSACGHNYHVKGKETDKKTDEVLKVAEELLN